MKRIDYELVEARVEEMYDFSITDEAGINKRCDEIQDFIQRCGWNLDDYIRRMMGFEDNKTWN